jgi:hypothetical protein
MRGNLYQLLWSNEMDTTIGSFVPSNLFCALSLAQVPSYCVAAFRAGAPAGRILECSLGPYESD